ncbi:MAG: hypothetical protein WBP95_13640 [Acidobacteriaceae bacterium]
MKWLVLFLSLSWVSPVWAAIAHGGACDGTTSCTPSSTANFQLDLSFAVNTSTTVPSAASGWTSVTTKAGTSSAMRVQCRVDYSVTAVATGTFSSAANVGLVGYTGTGARAVQDCATNGVAIGATASTSGSSTTPSCPALTLTNNAGTSWVVCGIFNAGGTADMCTPTNMTMVSAATTGDVGVFDTNGTVASWSAATCTNAASENWIAVSVEVLVPPTNPPVIPQLVNGDGGAANTASEANPGNNYRFKMDPALAGNTEIIYLAYNYSPSRTLSIVDDKGDTATKAVSCNDTIVSPGLSFATYYIQNLTAGATTLTFTFDAPITDFTQAHHQFSGIATSGSILDGTPSCGSQLRPSAVTIGNVTDPTGTTTTADGDLVVNAVFDEGSGYGFGNNSAIYDILFGSGYTGLFGEMQYGAAAQAIVQPNSGLIKPSMTFVQGSWDPYAYMTVAFKTTAGAGTARSTGRILRMLETWVPQSVPSMNWVFPCDSGNLLVFTYENNVGIDGTNVTAMGDAAGNTYAGYNYGGVDFAQYWITTNAVCNGQLFGFEHGSPANGDVTRVTVYEVTGASSSPAVDTGASANFSAGAVTTLSAAVTGGTQTSLSLAAAGGISNGEYLMLSSEVVLVTAGGGTTSITVTRGQFGTTPLSSIASGTGVWPSNYVPYPAITTSQANEIIFCSMNQGNGPNWDTINSTYDFASFPGLSDGNVYSNGDGSCHAYAPTAGTYNLGWLVDNVSSGSYASTSAVAVKLQGNAPTVRHRAWVIE